MIYCLPAIIRTHYTQLFAGVHQNIIDQPGGAESYCYGCEDFAGDFLDTFERFGIDNTDIFDLSRWNLLQYILHFGNDLARLRCSGVDQPAARLK